MPAGRFVGRIGGLAVALGVGAAVSFGAPAAWAEDSAGDGGGSAAASSPARSHAAKPIAAKSNSAKSNAVKVRAAARAASAAAATGTIDRQVTAKPRATSQRLKEPPRGDSRAPADSAATWAVAAAARREVGVADADEVSTLTATSSTATRVSLLGSVYQSGDPRDQVLSPDGGRAILTTDVTDQDAYVTATRVAVVNTATGRSIGSAQTINGERTSAPVVTADSSRAVITTRWAVAVIDTSTGAQVGSPIGISYSGQPVLSANGTRAVMAGNEGVVVINTTTGQQVGTTASPGSSRSIAGSGKGNNVLIITVDPDAGGKPITRVMVIDTTSGSQTGSTLTLGGSTPWQSPLFSSDGAHALFVTEDPDAAGGPLTRVAAINTGTGAQTSTTLIGSISAVVQTADSDHAVIATRVAETTRATLIDIVGGGQVGSTVNLAGAQYHAVQSAGAGHLLVTTYIANSSGTNIVNSLVSVIDTATGAQTGSTLTLAGRADRPPLVSADGTRALVANNAGTAVILNTATGGQTGATFTLTGEPQDFQLLTADGSRVLITTVDGSDLTGFTTRAAVFDTASGGQIGSTVTLRGAFSGSLLRADAGRALIVSYTRSPLLGTITSRVAVLNTTTGKQTGFTQTLSGEIFGADPLRADGSRVVLTRRIWNPFTMSGAARMTVINTSTGWPTNTLSLSGDLAWSPGFNADGSRMVVTTTTHNYFTGTSNSRLAVLRVV